MAQSQRQREPEEAEADIDIEMVSQQRGFQSVAKLKRWLARLFSDED